MTLITKRKRLLIRLLLGLTVKAGKGLSFRQASSSVMHPKEESWGNRPRPQESDKNLGYFLALLHQHHQRSGILFVFRFVRPKPGLIP